MTDPVDSNIGSPLFKNTYAAMMVVKEMRLILFELEGVHTNEPINYLVQKQRRGSVLEKKRENWCLFSILIPSPFHIKYNTTPRSRFFTK